MNPFFKNIIGVLFVLVISGIIIFFLFNNLTDKSFYKNSGVTESKDISSDINTYIDNFGVPHIFADNESDAYFAIGYFHARDRLWFMDFSRRVAEGKLSEILGKETVSYDKLFRTIGINRFAYDLYEKISPESKYILERYTEGVNFFIEENNNKLPLEFDVLNYKPEPWEPEHSLMLIRLMGWEMTYSWYCEYLFGKILKKFGEEKFEDLFPGNSDESPYVIKSNDSRQKQMSCSFSKLNIPVALNDFISANKSFKNYTGSENFQTGSNAWVINGEKSETGRPILANDPHLALLLPCKWYEMHISIKETDLNLTGFSIPGTPGIVIGRNDVISWGITNLMCDDIDFVYLKLDSVEKNKYTYQDKLYSLDSITEYIKVKGSKDEIMYMVYLTNIGPVISNLEKIGFETSQRFTTDSDYILTFKWTGFEASDEILAFHNINNSNSWQSFKSSLKNYGVPALNFIYADTSGNIGYHSAGKIPVRRTVQGSAVPYIPSENEPEWTGFVSLEDMPNVYNPDENFIVTANNSPQEKAKYYISSLFEPSYRARRIEEFLNSKNKFSQDELKLLQSDVNNIYAKEICNYLFEAYTDSATCGQEELKYIRLLKNWDYDMKMSSVPASIFAQFEVELYKNLYKNKLGGDLYDDFMYISSIPVKVTSKLLKNNSSWLFDISGTGEKEGKRDDVLRKSFRDVIRNLKNIFRTDDYSKWLWGELHKVIIHHPLGNVPALSPVLNIGPYECGGSGTTVNLAGYSFKTLQDNLFYECNIGPSMRMVIDLSDDKFYSSIIPGGQSGQPLHHDSRNQVRLWLNGEFKKVYFNRDIISDTKNKFLTIKSTKK